MNVPVSVLMPVFNGGKYLSAAIDSILTQTFREFEFLIVDDGSSDSTSKILREYAHKDGRIRITSRENRGLVASLNELLASAQGHLLARMDADDISLPDRLASQVTYMSGHPDVVCAGGHVEDVNEQGLRLSRREYPLDSDEIQQAALGGQACMCHPCFMMRREAVIAVGGYAPESFPAEDLDLLLRLGEVGKLANLDRVILKYRIHINSISERTSLRQRQVAQQVCQRAYRRRGLAVVTEAPTEGISEPALLRQHRLFLKYGWWAYNSRARLSAIRYGFRAVRSRPSAGNAWMLLACALCKPFGRARPPKGLLPD